METPKKQDRFWIRAIVAGISTGIVLWAMYWITRSTGLNQHVASIARLLVMAACQLFFAKRYAREVGGVTYLRCLGFMVAAMVFMAMLLSIVNIAGWGLLLEHENVISSLVLLIRAGKAWLILGIFTGLFTSVFIYKRK